MQRHTRLPKLVAVAVSFDFLYRRQFPPSSRDVSKIEGADLKLRRVNSTPGLLTWRAVLASL